MLNKRYHIHLICATNDQVDLLDELAIFMETKAFITRDLCIGNSASANYSRRCIEKCDFTIVLVGDSYGKLNNTGVSQMHLSYIYAKTKARPMMVLLKMHDVPIKDTLSRQLIDFSRMVEEQNSGSLYYYDDDVKIQEFISPLYNKFIKEHAGLGWIRVEKSAKANKVKKDKQSDNEQAKTQAAERRLNKKNSKNNALKSDAKSKSDTSANQKTSVVKPSSIDSHILVKFSTHAYEAGNLTDIKLTASITWREVLDALSDGSDVISKVAFQKAINEVVTTKALKLVQIKNSLVHAVSRTQVCSVDMETLQTQLISFGWLEIVKQEEGDSSQTLLALSGLAKKALH